MSRSARIVGTAVVVLVSLVLAGVAFQFLMVALPYLATYLLGVESTETISTIACGIWLIGPMALAVLFAVCVRSFKRLRLDSVGVLCGVIAYPALCVGLFLVSPSSDSWVSALAYMQSFVSVPVSIAIGVVWLLLRLRTRSLCRRRVAFADPSEPQRLLDRTDMPASSCQP